MTKEETATFAAWAPRRREFNLGKDKRWLTADDKVQEGDVWWLRHDEWINFGPEWYGKKIPLEHLCYFPMGSIYRIEKISVGTLKQSIKE